MRGFRNGKLLASILVHGVRRDSDGDPDCWSLREDDAQDNAWEYIVKEDGTVHVRETSGGPATMAGIPYPCEDDLQLRRVTGE